MPAVSGCSAPLTVCILPAPFIISLSPSQELWRGFCAAKVQKENVKVIKEYGIEISQALW